MSDTCALGDEARRRLGFLSHAEATALARRGILLPAPDTVLISRDVTIDGDAILWPGIILQALDGGGIAVGRAAHIYPGTRIVASAGGAVRIGAQAEIGEEGGFTIKAGTGEVIEIGEAARLLGGGSLSHTNRIGRGAQILGPIRCRNCTLGDGDSYRDPEPDARGGVLKGSGVARNVTVPTGSVIQAFGLFSEDALRPQSYFHPRSGG